MIAVLRHQAGDLIQDRYEILQALGSGAFGTVYGCRDCELDTPVAIKELHVLDDPETGDSERAAALAQFRREAINLSLLRHPHIVSGHYQPHHGTWLVCPVCGLAFRGSPTCPQHAARPIILRQRHYLVMEYVDGPNLEEASRAAGGALDWRAAVRYAIHIADALQSIHSRGWVHRDVKPENIRLRSAGDDAVLLDFGIATESGVAGEFSTRAQRHTTGGGTMGYAPDSAVERRHPDARSDLHALGMTLYRLVSGRDPQEGAELVEMRRQSPRDFQNQLPPLLDALIVSCINPDPEKRPQTAQDVAQMLKEILHPTAPANDTAFDERTPASTFNGYSLQAGFTFSNGECAGNVTQLVRLMDRFPDEAQEFLFDGDLCAWLEQMGRDDLAKRAFGIREEYQHRRAQGVEAWLLATGLVEPPQMQLSAQSLDFGTVWMGQRSTLNLTLCNNGRGYLFGFLRSRHPALQTGSEFEGNQATVPVTFDSNNLKRGEHRGDLIIDSSAGEIHVPFDATVLRRRAWTGMLTVVLWAVLGMLAGQWLRSFPMTHQSSAGWHWLDSARTPHWYPVAPLFGVALWGALMMFVAGESTRRRSCGYFFLSCSFATAAALMGAAFGNEILVTGDELLKPFMSPLSQEWAAGGWMFVGGILGACYGTLRRWRDVFTTRIFQILSGWLLAIFILYAVLASVLFVVHSNA